ncbi:MAG: dihydrolipoyl dehydrogenase [Candidatus Eutrophobiaceae bacterium]
MAEYDAVVIGGGPGGYVAAIRCAQLGMKVACVESRIGEDGKPALGGTCLNVGCIPSKALLDSSHQYSFLKHDAAEHGIKCFSVNLDLKRMMKRKSDLVLGLTRGIGGLLRKNKITWLRGHGRLLSANEIEINPLAGGHEERSVVRAQHIIIATGSVPAPFPLVRVDDDQIVDSTGALSFPVVPRKLGVIGAGVIGLELGSVWSRLGSEVTILEAADSFLPIVDRQIATEAHKVLTSHGLNICLGARVTGVSSNSRQISVSYESGGVKEKLDVDKLLVATGRKPNTEGLGVEEVGLNVDERGFIVVDAQCRTNFPKVYAIGDVVRGPMLAHKASEEGVAVAETIAGQAAAHCDFSHIPWVIYTWPEIAWAGRSEQELKERGVPFTGATFPFMASGRARASGQSQGMVKILRHSDTDRLLGVHILGANASELIAEGVLAMEFMASSEDLMRTIHAHPTLSEGIHEAALASNGRAIHF